MRSCAAAQRRPPRSPAPLLLSARRSAQAAPVTLLLVYFLLIIFRYMRRILHRFRLSKEETVSGAFAAVSRPATEEDVGRTL